MAVKAGVNALVNSADVKGQFVRCLQLVRVSEKGKDDDPDDPGGRTNDGITQTEWDAFCQLHGMAPSDVWKAPWTQLTEIYLTSYWLPWSDRFAPGIDYVFFDVSVLQGQAKAVKLLQRALKVGADGHIGVVTMSALKAAPPRELIVSMSALRGQDFRAIVRARPTSQKYLKGWITRANRVCDDALKMAA